MALPITALLKQWESTRPDLNTAPMELPARLSRLNHQVQARLGENFCTHEIQQWQFDVLATLRRCRKPISASTLADYALISASALTNRVDKLEAAGLVERIPNPSSRREVLIGLTPAGVRKVDNTLPDHLDACTEALNRLDASEQKQLAFLLRKAAGEEVEAEQY